MKLLHKGKMFLIAAAILPLSILEANPGFSRQMDMGCMACHSQTMSQLNSFGRKFAASGLTMTSGSQSMIDGETLKLGLPAVLNAGVLLKARYIKSDPETSTHDDFGYDRGNLELFKVSKIFFGGKIAENVGGFMNFENNEVGGKVVFAHELGSGYAGIAAFMQNDFGPFSGMEYYNTGLYAPLKLFENRKSTNAAQATELGHGPASGVQAYYGGDMFYLMGGAYVPATSRHEGLDVGTDVIGITRAAFAPTIGDWTVMIGAYAINGTAKINNYALDDAKLVKSDAFLYEITRRAYGVDMQIEGEVAGMSTLIALNSVLKNETEVFENDASPGNIDEVVFTNQKLKAGDNKAFSAEVQVNPWEPFGVKAAYLHYNDMFNYTAKPNNIDKWDRDDYSLGFDYSYRQNVRFAAEYTYSNIANTGGTNSLSDSDTYVFYTMIGF